MELQELKKYLFLQNIDLSDDAVLKLDKYLDLLIETNKVMNLTAIKTKEEMIEKHLYDSLLAAKTYDFKNKKIIDIGSGAGLPGIPLSIYFKDAYFVLLEPTQKRANFLKKVVEELELKNVTVISKRAEELGEYIEYFDIATARAVANTSVLLELGTWLIKPLGVFIALKGSKANEEIQEAKKAISILNLEIVDVFEERLISNGDERFNIVFKKVKQTPKKYPRRYSEIKNKPL